MPLLFDQLPKVCKRFTKQQEAELYDLMKQGDEEARRLLIESQLPLVRWIVNRFCTRTGWNEHQEAESFARWYLVDAVDNKWHPGRAKLCTFLMAFLGHHLSNLMRGDGLIKLPRNLNPQSRLQVDRKRAKGVQSISDDSGVVSNAEALAFADKNPGPEELAEVNEEVTRVRVILGKLRAGDAEILRHRMNGLTLDQIAQKRGVSKERIRQIELRASESFRRLWGDVDVV